MELILASASERRSSLMRMCGYDFTVMSSSADEHISENNPSRLVESLSLIKARTVFDSLDADRRKNAVVIGSDTVVTLDGRIIGKPASEDEARAMLRMESGRENRVYTGLAIVGMDGNVESVCSDMASVFFTELTDDEIGAYVKTGEPMDKAGAYGIQGCFSMFIERIEGSYFTVVGLPLHLLYRELKRIGVTPKQLFCEKAYAPR